MQTTEAENKAIYSQFHDEIIAKRFESPFALRKYMHRRQYNSIVELIPDGATVLDAGCGEGVLCFMLAQKGCKVTGVDLSEPNIQACNNYAAQYNLTDSIIFLVGDVENLPVEDKSFDYVISSHVLEHLPNFIQGVRELNRAAKVQVIAAIPTALNMCSWVQLGRDRYWTFSRHTIYALPYGFLRVLWAFISGKEGVNEGYAGHKELIHIFRFPWRGAQLLRQGNLKIDRYEASACCIPYANFLAPVYKYFEWMLRLPIIRNFGYGTTYICTPTEN